MTYTRTYAIVSKDGREFVEDQIVRVKRKPTEADAFYLPHGYYEIVTASGPIKVEAPTWILYDADGYPYPVTVDVFGDIYEVLK